MKFRSTAIAASLVLASIANAYAVTPAYEYTDYTANYDGRAFTLGFEFSLSSATAIDALAYFNDGKGNDHEVGIWDTSGNLLTSITVHGTDTLSGHFYYAAISTLTLSAGSYVIAGTYNGNGEVFPDHVTGVTTAPHYTWTRDLQELGAGLLFPGYSYSSYGQNGIAAVNFSVAAVPEPATYGMLLAGLGLLGIAARRTSQA